MDILLLVALIVLNGLFAMAEIALVTARKSRLQKLADEGDAAAATAVSLGDEPTQFLSTVQIGITAISVLNGIVGQAALAGPLAELLVGFGLEANASRIGATTLVVVSITYFTIVIGELVPKRLAQLNAEGVARFMARPVQTLAKLSGPFVWLLSASTDGLLRLVGKKEVASSNLTEEDIHAMLVEGSASGVIEKSEHDMVRNVFRLDDRQIASLMTPRSEIVFLDADQSFADNLETLISSDHTRFPVCHGGLHELVGIVTAKRLLKQHIRYRPNSGDDDSLAERMAKKLDDVIGGDLSPVVYVPESLNGMQLLEQFRESGVQMVFVVDEYGEVLGLITLQDLLEALAGEFKPVDAEDVWAVQRDDGSWLIDGLIPIPELKDRLELRDVPEEDKGRYHTLSGMMMWLIGKVPRTGEVAVWEGWELEVVDLDGNRIDKVLATQLPEPVESEAPVEGLLDKSESVD